MAASSSIDLIKAIESKIRVPGCSGLGPAEQGSVADDLRQACYANELDQCHHMIADRGCDVNDRADGKGKWKSGMTPLHVAATQGHVGIIGLLLEFRADTSIKNKDAELPLHIAARAGQSGAVLQLLEAERAKPMHIRKSELKFKRPRVRTRDLVNKGRFRLPPTFALSSETLRATVSSTKSAISMAHEKDTSKKKNELREAKFTIAGSQFVEFEIANFGLRHSRINDQKLVEADPPFGDVPEKLSNHEECAGCLVMLNRGGHVRVIDKVMLAQSAGAIAVVIVNDSNKEFEPKTSSSKASEVTIPVVGVSRDDGKVIRHCIKNDADAVVDLSFSVVQKDPARDDDEKEEVVQNSSSMPNLPSRMIERSSLIEKSPVRFLWIFC